MAGQDKGIFSNKKKRGGGVQERIFLNKQIHARLPLEPLLLLLLISWH
jgi:hypothetical protein